MTDLTGRIALVIGSASGMGAAITKRLAREGARVVVHGRTESQVEQACRQLEQDVPGAEVTGHAAELADRDAVSALLRAVPDADIVVDNAGPTPSVPITTMTDEQWTRYFDTYVTTAFRLGQHFLPGMVGRGWGRMLFGAGVTCSYSPGDKDVAEQMTAWLTCKSALLGLSRGLAEVTAGSGVTVNAFIPGPTHTEESYLSRATPPQGMRYADIEREFFAGPGLSSLLGRFIHPDEVADVVAFLASPQSSAITGAAVRIDGGIIRPIL